LNNLIVASSPVLLGSSKTEPQALGHRDNFNASKILLATTLRTIDLGGKKISGLLFSRL
jgi:hypothetical protein